MFIQILHQNNVMKLNLSVLDQPTSHDRDGFAALSADLENMQLGNACFPLPAVEDVRRLSFMAQEI